MPYQAAAVATPNTPPAGVVDIFPDVNDLNRLKYIDPTGVVNTLTDTGIDQNLIANPEFQWNQRIAAALTNFAPTTALGWGAAFNNTGRFPSFDRWGFWTGNTTTPQLQQVDTIAAPEANLSARYYARFKQLTNGTKFAVNQCLDGPETAGIRGRYVRLQFKMRWSVCASPPQQVRLGILQLTNAGTVDAAPFLTNFITAVGANGVDPTFGTNLSLITPSIADGGTISGSAVTCNVTNSWVRYSGLFLIPATVLNIIPIIYLNNVCSANDDLLVSEAGLYSGQEIKDWSQPIRAMDYLRCLRFYQKTFALGTPPAQTGGVGNCLRSGVAIAGAVATSSTIYWSFSPPMYKVPPTITFMNPSAGNAFMRNIPAATDATVTASANATEKGCDVNATGLAGWTAGQEIKVCATADAEI